MRNPSLPESDPPPAAPTPRSSDPDAANPAPPPDPVPGRWLATATLLIATFMNVIDVTIVNVALPGLQRSLQASDSAIEWVVAAYILSFALFLMPFGRLGDVIGRRFIFMLGVTVFTLASLLCGMAPSIGWLVAARVLQGLGGAMMAPQTLAIIPALFPPAQRGLALSLFGVAAGLGSVSGPIVGGLLIAGNPLGLAWRSVFLVNVPIGILALIGSLRYLPRLPRSPGLRNDFVGIGIAVVTLLLVVIPLIEGRPQGWPAWCLVMLGLALPAALVFFAWESHRDRRGAAQLLPVGMMKNRNFVTGVLAGAALFSGIPPLWLVMAVFLQNGHGFTALQSGLTTAPFPCGVLLGSLVSGRLGIRWTRQRMALGALCLSAAMLGIGHVANLPAEGFHGLGFAWPLALGGLGLGLTIAPLFQTVLAAAGTRDTGSASGTLQAFQQIGGALGIAVMGDLFFARLDHAVGVPQNADYAAALNHALWYSTVSFALVAVLALLLPAPTPDARPHPLRSVTASRPLEYPA